MHPKVQSGLLIHQKHIQRFMCGIKTYEIRPKNCLKVGNDIAIIEVPPRKPGDASVKRILGLVRLEKVFLIETEKCNEKMLKKASLSKDEFETFSTK